MNPFPVVLSLLQRNRVTLLFFVALIAFAVALGIAVTTQERAIRQGSARAADKFDLVVGAPGSPFDLVLAAVYARPSAMGLIAPEDLTRLLAEPEAEIVAPVAFGDNFHGFPILGTTAQFVDHLGGIAEGRMFAEHQEALLGARVPLALGEEFHAVHGGLDSEEMLHEHEIVAVGRLALTNTPWDSAVIVPVEQVWETHGLPTGHADEEQIGPPFDAEHLPGVPAVVVKPKTVPAAYGLRNAYRTNSTQAVFPAEILVQLYALLGDARSILTFLALATQVLVVAAILSGVMVILRLYRTRFAVLRALGASRGFIFATAWLYVTILIAAGAVIGTALGAAVAWVVSGYLERQTGVAMPVSLTWQELQLVLGLLGAGLLMAALPAVTLFRQPVAEALRGSS